jgi:hypothetical protein
MALWPIQRSVFSTAGYSPLGQRRNSAHVGITAARSIQPKTALNRNNLLSARNVFCAQRPYVLTEGNSSGIQR